MRQDHFANTVLKLQRYVEKQTAQEWEIIDQDESSDSVWIISETDRINMYDLVKFYRDRLTKTTVNQRTLIGEMEIAYNTKAIVAVRFRNQTWSDEYIKKFCRLIIRNVRERVRKKKAQEDLVGTSFNPYHPENA